MKTYKRGFSSMPPARHDTTSLYSFDLESARLIPKGCEDLLAADLGITTAATLGTGREARVLRLFYTEILAGRPAALMSQADANNLVDWLLSLHRRGETILTWNGLGFDFPVLAAASGRKADCAEIALGHVDLFFYMVCRTGFGIGLDRVARGMGLGGKDGYTDADMPGLWANGEHETVINYLVDDVEMTLEIALAAMRYGGLTWRSKKNQKLDWRMPHGGKLLSVAQAMALPMPDTTFAPAARRRWPRTKFAGWMGSRYATDEVVPAEMPEWWDDGEADETEVAWWAK